MHVSPCVPCLFLFLFSFFSSPSLSQKKLARRGHLERALERELRRNPSRVGERPKLPTINRNEETNLIISEVETCMMGVWEDRGLGSLWELNSLFYAGAATAISEMNEPQQETKEDGPEAHVQDRRAKSKLQTSPTIKNRMREIRRGIGWLEAELSRKQASGNKGLSKKQSSRLRKIQRMWEKKTLTVKRLKTLRERQKSLLRIRSLQQRRQRLIHRRWEAKKDVGKRSQQRAEGKCWKILEGNMGGESYI